MTFIYQIVFKILSKITELKYRSLWLTFIMRSKVMFHWLIIPKDDIHPSNSLHGIKQNHWTMKCRSWWPTFIFKSTVMSHWFIILKNDVHPSNSLQDIKQNLSISLPINALNLVSCQISHYRFWMPSIDTMLIDQISRHEYTFSRQK